MRLSPEDIPAGEWASEQDERRFWRDVMYRGGGTKQLTSDGLWRHVMRPDDRGEEVTAEGGR